MARMSAAQLLQEIRGVVNLYRAGKDTESIPAPRYAENEIIVFLSGLGAAPFVYGGIASRLSFQSGMPVVFPHIGTPVGNLNLLTLDKSLLLLERGVEELQRQGKVVRAIVGHSLGGIQGAAMLANWSEILLFAVGSPIWGTPWAPLARFASSRLGFDVRNPPRHFREMREKLPQISDRIVTISSPGDYIAPPRRCHIKGATNIVLNRRMARETGRPHVPTVHIDCIAHPTVTNIIAGYLQEGTQPVRACAP